MSYPQNQHRLELKRAQEAQERERELANGLANDTLDEDDGGDFDI